MVSCSAVNQFGDGKICMMNTGISLKAAPSKFACCYFTLFKSVACVNMFWTYLHISELLVCLTDQLSLEGRYL